MEDVCAKILISDVFLDESIYPRENIDHKRIGIFEENLRDGFVFEPIEVQVWPDTGEEAKKGKYRILDGVHRWSAYKKTGDTQIDVVIKILDNIEPILYAAKMAIGPKQLTEAETRNTARRAFQANSRLTASEIGRAIGRSRQAVDKYIADLRATALFEQDLKVFKLNQLGIPQDRIAKRVGLGQQRISRYLLQMPQVAKGVNADLLKGFTVPQVAQKHGWPEPLVWSQALVNADDFGRFKALQWGIRTWDVWNFMDCDNRFGDEWPGRIPAQLVAHILYFFSEPNDLVLDPMAGGGVCADTCLAMGRRCWSLDMEDRPDTRPEIEPWFWDLEKDWENLLFFNAKEKPVLIICDPPYFDKKAKEYAEKSISGLSKTDYLVFLEKFFLFLKKIARKDAWLAFINADWRDFQNCSPKKEDAKKAILLTDYYEMFKKTGWSLTHIIQAPMSSERFNAGVVSAMQKKKILGVISRYVMFLN
jgi:hypothetical protein